MSRRRILVATHGHCFDGMASAAVFECLMRHVRPDDPLEFRILSCGYGPNMSMVPEAWLDGDENAILDFRYTPSARLTWYFDHHLTAFGSEEERDRALGAEGPGPRGSGALGPGPGAPGAEGPGPRGSGALGPGPGAPGAEGPGPRGSGALGPGPGAPGAPGALGAGAKGPGSGGVARVYYDATYGSCTRLIADTAAREFGLDVTHLAELTRWAEMIDTASFASAADAIRRDEPVLQLASVVEHHADRAFLETAVPMLVERGVRAVAQDPWIQGLWAPIEAAHAALVERVRARSKRLDRVVVTDLSDAPLEMTAKFVSYALFPECVYSITLSRNRQHYKLAVGYNPWCGVPRDHNIAEICKRYGGGGHPVVGAATFKLADAAVARAAADTIARELAA